MANMKSGKMMGDGVAEVNVYHRANWPTMKFSGEPRWRGDNRNDGNQEIKCEEATKMRQPY